MAARRPPVLAPTTPTNARTPGQRSVWRTHNTPTLSFFPDTTQRSACEMGVRKPVKSQFFVLLRTIHLYN